VEDRVNVNYRVSECTDIMKLNKLCNAQRVV